MANTATVLSFTGFQTPVTPTTKKVTVSTKAASEGSIKFYLDLCAQKNVTPDSTIGLTAVQIDEKIKAVKSFFPASEAQLALIDTKIAGLQTAGVAINLGEELKSKLTGGKNGTASNLINDLIGIETKAGITATPTDSQIQFLVNMYLCPDCGFEEYGVNRRVQLEGTAWRMPTPDEFANDIKSKMSKSDASKFIDSNRPAFFTWKNSRVKPGQLSYIQQLEARLADTSKVHAKEFSIGANGVISEVTRATDKSKDWSPAGYTPLTEIQLAMFSMDDASQYIDLLKKDIARKDSTPQEAEISDERGAQTVEEAIRADFDKLDGLMYTLESIAGYSDDELHSSVKSTVTGDVVSADVTACKEKIRGFMLDLIPTYITLEGLVTAIEDLPIAQSIFLGKF